MKKRNRVCALLMAAILIISILPANAFAAAPWPTLSASRYCEMISPGQIPVYRYPSLTTRGTASPARSYNSYVSKNDKIYIYEITDDYTKLSLPTSSGRKIGYVKTSTLLGVSTPTEVVTSRAKITTYQYASTSTPYGFIAANDTVYKLGTTKSGYVLVLYNAASGSRAYKAGFITKADYERMAGDPAQDQSEGQNMSYALYNSSGGRLTCSFDGYNRTSGKHEGIDFAKSQGSCVYSLTDGVITRVTQGYRGSRGLSTIAIYSAATNKTVVYLHTDPLDSLKEGQYISRGQLIAYEDWRGISKSDDAHTHVEMRTGKCRSAAKSVDHYILDNPDPTAFWNSQGYLVK